MLVLLQYLNLMQFDRNRDMVHKVVRALVAQIPIQKNQYRKFETNIFPEKELRGHSPNFHIHVSVSDLYTVLPRGSAYSAAGNMWTDPGNTVYKSLIVR
jgi:hypothetical protein